MHPDSVKMKRPNGRTARNAQAPSGRLLAMEWLAPAETIASVALWPLLLQGTRGDGHSVMVFPGLAAPDSTTAFLRHYLRSLGYDAQGWAQGFNLGPRPGVLEGCLARVTDVHRRSGRKVSLIGWSLGGLYARELAKMAPDSVRLAISMGSPFTGPQRANHAWRVYQCLTGKPRESHELSSQLDQCPPVPTTSIYSRTDGVVAWQCSLQSPGPLSESIEVRASHVGMGSNPSVLHAIGDRLAQPEGQWRPFQREGARRWFYARPPFADTAESERSGVREETL